jgi:transposase
MEEKREEIIHHVFNELLRSGKNLSEAKAKELSKSLFAEGEEALTFLLLELAAKTKLSARSPSTPSGMIPSYEKESAKPAKKKKNKAGGQAGHPGASRTRPDRIDKTVEHRLECCPDCGGSLQRCEGEQSVRSRIIEDIPEEIQPEITEHVIHRDYCPQCKKHVEPKVESALPKATLGNRLLSLTAYWHYSLGMTISQILDTLDYHLQFEVTKGGLIQKWHQLRMILFAWYMMLATEVQASAVVHADETGWRVNGKTHWLWCFTSDDATFYMVDRSRGSPALKKFFQEEFNGVLVTDFWAAYDAVSCLEHQCCLFHLLNELEKVNQRNTSDEWIEFSKKTKRLLKDAIRLRAREDFTPEKYAERIDRFYKRLLDLALASYHNKDTRRLAKRLEKYRDELFVFLDHPNVPSDNNHGEREIRMAVIMRKMSYGNRSEDGALTQSVLMSVFRTLKRRGYNPIDAVVSALAEYIRTGHLPSFPPSRTSDD